MQAFRCLLPGRHWTTETLTTAATEFPHRSAFSPTSEQDLRRPPACGHDKGGWFPDPGLWGPRRAEGSGCRLLRHESGYHDMKVLYTTAGGCLLKGGTGHFDLLFEDGMDAIGLCAA